MASTVKCPSCQHSFEVDLSTGKLALVRQVMAAHPEWKLGQVTLEVLTKDPSISPLTISTQFRANRR